MGFSSDRGVTSAGRRRTCSTILENRFQLVGQVRQPQAREFAAWAAQITQACPSGEWGAVFRQVEASGVDLAL